MNFRLLTFTIFLIFPIHLFCQVLLKGNLIDEQSNPIVFASIQLKNDSTLINTFSNTDGYFEIKVIPHTYQFKITYAGKTIFDTIINIQQSTSFQLQLNLPKDELSTVIHSANKKWIKEDQQKISIQVGESPYKKGFFAKDLIGLLPNIIMDRNSISRFGVGEISLSLNGKISPLKGAELIEFLNSIPSSLIERIDYYHDTGSSNDASSGGIIIDIIYKSETKAQTSANVFVEHNQNKYASQKFGTYFSLFTPKLETYINLRYARGYENIVEKRTLSNHNYSWKGKDQTKRTIDPWNINYYFYYKFSEKTQVGGQFYTNIYKSPQEITGEYHYNLLSSLDYHYESTGNRSGDLKSYSLFGAHQLTKNIKMRLEWDYIQSNQNDKRTVTTFKSLGDNEIINHNDFRYNNHATNLHFEYKKDKITINWGAKYTLNRNRNDLYTYNEKEAIEINQPYNVREEIKAAFGDATYTINNWLFRGGLRYEQTLFRVNNINTDEYDYDLKKLFPNIFISKKLTSGHSLRMRYNYSIQRPRFGDITPFRKYFDDNAYSVGNPFLRPQFRHYFELGSTLKKGWGITTYYALTKNGQAMVFYVDTVNNFQVSQPMNFYTLHNIGASINKYHQITDKWNLIHFAFIYYNTSTFNNDYAKIAEPFNGLAFYYNTQLQYSNKNTFINISGHLDPPRKAIYFKSKGSYELNFEIDQRLKKFPLKFNFQVRDIFNSSPIINQFRTNTTDQTYYINESSRRLILRVTYLFGKNNQNRRHNSEYNREADRYRIP